MGHLNFECIKIGPDRATQVLAIIAPGNVAIPTMTGGVLPKFLRCTAHTGTATNVITVSPKQSAANGASATGLPLAIGESVVLNVVGYSHIGYDEIGDGTSALQLYPLEDF